MWFWSYFWFNLNIPFKGLYNLYTITHSIGGFTEFPFFCCFFLTFLLLHEKEFAVSSTFFVHIFIRPYPHKADCHLLIKILFKNFVYEREWYFKIGLKFFSSNFCPVCDSLGSAYMNLQKWVRNWTYFFMEKKQCTKTNKSEWKTDTAKIHFIESMFLLSNLQHTSTWSILICLKLEKGQTKSAKSWNQHEDKQNHKTERRRKWKTINIKISFCLWSVTTISFRRIES